MTLNLDKSCVLCDIHIPYLNEFLNHHFSTLSQKLSEQNLFKTMHELLQQNKLLLESQGNEAPDISIEELRIHFTIHEPKLELIIKRDVLNIEKLQKNLLKQDPIPSVINSYIRISKHKCLLLKKLQSLQTTKNKYKPYKFA